MEVQVCGIKPSHHLVASLKAFFNRKEYISPCRQSIGPSMVSLYWSLQAFQWLKHVVILAAQTKSWSGVVILSEHLVIGGCLDHSSQQIICCTRKSQIISIEIILFKYFNSRSKSQNRMMLERLAMISASSMTKQIGTTCHY